MECTTESFVDDELEDGELSESDGSYTPLQRPEAPPVVHAKLASAVVKMDDAPDLEDIGSEFGHTTDTTSDSDDAIKIATRLDKGAKRLKKKQRKAPIVPKPIESSSSKPDRFKKYNIWTENLQEETLMENLRGCDVEHKKSDRNVEQYDFSIKYHLNGERGVKRRFDDSGNSFGNKIKRFKGETSKKKTQLRQQRGRSTSCESFSEQNEARYILDLATGPNNTPDDVARDIANKLYEEKDELLKRVVNVLGKDLPIALFKETQKIERDGGMMILNGRRRRTPGGVFLFLIKHSCDVSQENKKLIFHEEMKKSVKERKEQQAVKRDMKVEELKKRLNLREKLSSLVPQSLQHNSNLLKPETHTNMSNPPPSPVPSNGQENSPEYTSHAINHVNDSSPEKINFGQMNEFDEESLTGYDDVLDMNCDDMEMT